jgi:hypothetical protein
LAGVKVSEAPELTVRSASPLPALVVTVTFEEGCTARRTV